MILKNDKFEEANPTVVTNARNVLEDDMQAVHFPWKRNNSGPGLPKEPISLIDRIIVREYSILHCLTIIFPPPGQFL